MKISKKSFILVSKKFRKNPNKYCLSPTEHVNNIGKGRCEMSEHAYEELIRLLERDIIVPNQIMFTVAKVAEDLSVRKRNKLMKVYNHYNDLYNKKNL